MRAYRIAYDGREFSGFQRQPDVPTVEDALFDAFEDLGVADLPRDAAGGRDRPPGYAAAGRTDAGVSAVAQTVAFEAPDWLTARALCSELPGSVRAWASADVPDGFHATHDATRRTYRYYLFAPPSDEVAAETSGAGTAPPAPPAPPVDDDRVADALGRLAGTHDFRNFTPDDRGTERDLRATATRDGDTVVLELSADGFPREFVRRAVALVRAVGTGDAPPSKVDRALNPEPLSGPEGIGPMPPGPLVLWDVAYEPSTTGLAEPVRFAVDGAAATSARETFGERYVTARSAAAVSGGIRDRIGSTRTDPPPDDSGSR